MPTPAQVQAALRLMPGRNATDGWAFAGDVNFAGPGWSGVFRTRPRNFFDLASKIHDLHYCLHDLSIVERGKDNLPFVKSAMTAVKRSHMAKSDYLFRLMNGLKGTQAFSTRLLNAGSGAIFYGNENFLKNDGFVNALATPEVINRLNNPSDYLMIPYESLPAGQQPTNTFRRSWWNPRGLASRNGTEANYLGTPQAIDVTPGFKAWFQQEYSAILGQLMAVTDQAGS
jgi:hypothetical protein